MFVGLAGLLGCEAARGSHPAPSHDPIAATPAVPLPIPADVGVRGEVVLVVLGSFPPDLVDAVQTMLEQELQVEVRRAEAQPLPAEAFYRPRRRYRAEKLLALLPAMVPEASPTTKILGLTASDISTTNGKYADWGIFGLGDMPGPAAAISSHRLTRGGRDRAHVQFRVASTALHEIGHTFGLDHCEEDRCPMQDAEGGIANTDTSSGHLGPGCQAKLDARAPMPTAH
jgi:archaemetzincin